MPSKLGGVKNVVATCAVLTFAEQEAKTFLGLLVRSKNDVKANNRLIPFVPYFSLVKTWINPIITTAKA